MPPLSRHKHSLPWLLNELISFLDLPGLENSRIMHVEVMDSFVVFSFLSELSAFGQFAVDMRRKENPVLMAFQRSIPG